jgi:mannose-1-phosphate guanylyltransferase
MKAIILVGGQGTRMRPLTDRLPKNIAPLCGTPFLTYQFEFLKSAGVKEIVLSLGYRPDDIRKIYGNGRKFGVKIYYVTEDVPLGTSGAIKNAERFVKGSPVVVMNGDILTDIPLKKMIAAHYEADNLATLGLVRVEDPSPYGLVILNSQGKIQKFLEKPKPDETVVDTINAGVYVFEPGVMDFIPSGVNHSAERGLFPALLQAGVPFGGYVWKGYWQDIGTPRKYLTTQWDVLNGAFPILSRVKRGPSHIYRGKRVWIGRDAVVQGPVLLEEGCFIGDGARILPYSVIGRKCVIGPGAVISKSLLWEGVKVGKNAKLEEVVLARKCFVAEGAQPPVGSVWGEESQIT